MHTAVLMELASLLEIIEDDGLLLLSDNALPSVVSLVAGGPIRGSWWGDPRARGAYHLYNALADHPRVLIVKLVSGKVTFVHPRLWPAVVSVGTSRESWQVSGLSEAETVLLHLVDDAGELPWDDVPRVLPPDARPSLKAVRTLESRLLVLTSEVHTPSGAHAKNLETWSAWAARVGCAPPFPAVSRAREQLEDVLTELNERHNGRGRLPWQPSRRDSER